MRRIIIGAILLLTILHQDWWWWDDSETLVFGFLPIGLAFHAGVSVTAAVLWTLAVRYCWPANLDEDEAVTVSDSREGGGG